MQHMVSDGNRFVAAALLLALLPAIAPIAASFTDRVPAAGAVAVVPAPTTASSSSTPSRVNIAHGIKYQIAADAVITSLSK